MINNKLPYWTNSFCVVLLVFMLLGVNFSRRERHSSDSRSLSRLNLTGGFDLDLLRAKQRKKNKINNTCKDM